MQVLVWFSNESGKQSVVVDDLAEARQLAKRLAMETGKRTMVERVRSPKWRVYAVDGLTQEKLLIWTELSKPEVIRRWRLWNEQGTASALLIVPSWRRVRLTINGDGVF